MERLFDCWCDFLEELALPLRLLARVLRRKISIGLAWWLLDTWWPCRKYRRLRMHWRLWRASRYRGTDEFHRSFDIDGTAMLEMTQDEQKAYMDKLMRRREQMHLCGK